MINIPNYERNKYWSCKLITYSAGFTKCNTKYIENWNMKIRRYIKQVHHILVIIYPYSSYCYLLYIYIFVLFYIWSFVSYMCTRKKTRQTSPKKLHDRAVADHSKNMFGSVNSYNSHQPLFNINVLHTPGVIFAVFTLVYKVGGGISVHVVMLLFCCEYVLLTVFVPFHKVLKL